MRPMFGSLAVLSLLMFSVQAGSIFDPQIMVADGGDATDIDVATHGISIMLTNAGNENPFLGGGIFVFHNIGADLFTFDVSVQFMSPMFPEGFFLDPTIVIPPSTIRQTPTFKSSQFPNRTCADLQTFSETSACLIMEFGLQPGPLVPHGTNFILDFDSKVDGVYVGPDANIASGSCLSAPTLPGCTTDTSNARVGAFPSGGDAVAGVPEPGYGLALLLCAAGLRIYHRRLQCRR